MSKIDTSKSELSDEELMSFYQAGDFSSFEILYARHSGRVYEYLRKRVVPSVAQEVMQEIFEKVHRSRSKYNSQYPFLPWLFAISRNALADFFKLSESKVSYGVVSDSEAILGQLTPAVAVESSPVDLSLALKTLPSGQRRAIELRYLQDWSFQKIASDMNTSPDNARQLISRGIKKLRSLAGRGGRDDS